MNKDISMNRLFPFIGKNVTIVDILLILSALGIGVVFEWNIIVIFILGLITYALIYQIDLRIDLVLASTVIVYFVGVVLSLFEDRADQSEMVFVVFYASTLYLIYLFYKKIIKNKNSDEDLVLNKISDIRFNARQLWASAILAISLIMGFYFGWQLTDIVLFLVFISVFLFKASSQKLALVALGFLIVTPVLLSFDREAQAEEYAVYAYYFLVMAVMRGVGELNKGNCKEPS